MEREGLPFDEVLADAQALAMRKHLLIWISMALIQLTRLSCLLQWLMERRANEGMSDVRD